MEKRYQHGQHRIVIIFLLAFMISCASVPYINVVYRLPPEKEILKGKKIYLDFEDRRGTNDILGKGAKKDFRTFSDSISFSLARGTEPGFKIGLFEVPALFKETFKRRFENSGVEILPGKSGDVGVVIVLEEFQLDLVGRKWLFRMGYEVKLVKEGTVLRRQMISGQGERIKLLGKREADKIVEDNFTELVNRFDVERLFSQAGL